MSKLVWFLAVALVVVFGAVEANAGPVFLTGHDPDFHAQVSAGAANLLAVGLSFVTGGTYNGGVQKFLWVEGNIAPPSGHLVGEDGLVALGLTSGTHYDAVDAAGFAAVNFANYSAIAVASSFGGLLTQAELDGLIARKTEIASFVNGGKGLLALSECFPDSGDCSADLLGPSPNVFGFLPIVVSAVPTAQGYTVTPFGASLGLTNDDVNDPTHNSFGVTAGLNVVDTDAAGVPTTLAGNVTIGGGGFTPVPEPASMALLGLGLAGLAFGTRKRA